MVLCILEDPLVAEPGILQGGGEPVLGRQSVVARHNGEAPAHRPLPRIVLVVERGARDEAAAVKMQHDCALLVGRKRGGNVLRPHTTAI